MLKRLRVGIHHDCTELIGPHEITGQKQPYHARRTRGTTLVMPGMMSSRPALRYADSKAKLGWKAMPSRIISPAPPLARASW